MTQSTEAQATFAALLDEIATDEAMARKAIKSSAPWWEAQSFRVIHGGEWEVCEANVQTAAHIARHDPARVIADCRIWREVVALLLADAEDGSNAVRREWAADILRQMVHAYAADVEVAR